MRYLKKVFTTSQKQRSKPVQGDQNTAFSVQLNLAENYSFACVLAGLF